MRVKFKIVEARVEWEGPSREIVNAYRKIFGLNPRKFWGPEPIMVRITYEFGGKHGEVIVSPTISEKKALTLIQRQIKEKSRPKLKASEVEKQWKRLEGKEFEVEIPENGGASGG